MSNFIDQNKIDQTAREWLVRLYADSPSDELKAEFREWVASDKAHHDAFLKAEKTWQSAGLADLSDETLSLAKKEAETNQKSTNNRASRIWPTSLVASIAVIFVTTLLLLSPKTEPVNYMTATGEQKTITLSDGSIVTLDADTSINVVISPSERLISLQRGLARFQVNHNPNLPFAVSTAHTQVEVLGTTFDVRLGNSKVDVSVLEGTVAVSENKTESIVDRISHLLDQQDHKMLKAGQRISASLEGHLGVKSEYLLQKNADWTQGRFVYDGIALAEIIQDINRYRSDKIYINNASLKQLKITTSFDINQADQVVEGLAISQSLQLKETAQGLEISSKP